jgi:hypothetical protein
MRLDELVLDAAAGGAEFQGGGDVEGGGVAEEGLEGVGVAGEGAGVEFLEEGGVAEGGSVGGLGVGVVVVVREGAAVWLGVAERAEVEAEDFGDAPGPEGEEVVLVSPELGA